MSDGRRLDSSDDIIAYTFAGNGARNDRYRLDGAR